MLGNLGMYDMIWLVPGVADCDFLVGALRDCILPLILLLSWLMLEAVEATEAVSSEEEEETVEGRRWKMEVNCGMLLLLLLVVVVVVCDDRLEALGDVNKNGRMVGMMLEWIGALGDLIWQTKEKKYFGWEGRLLFIHKGAMMPSLVCFSWDSTQRACISSLFHHQRPHRPRLNRGFAPPSTQYRAHSAP